MTEIKTYVAYYRVSTDDQGERGFGLEAQKSAILDFVGNDIILRDYTEIESGKSHKNRPILQEALIACRRLKAKLIVAKLDRLSRNVHFVAGLIENKVEFLAVDYPSADALQLYIVVAFADYERKLIGKRTKDALAAAKRSGVVLGRNGKILAAQNKQRADDFARAMEPILNGIMDHDIVTYQGLANELNRLKIPTYKGYGKWHVATVYKVMKR